MTDLEGGWAPPRKVWMARVWRRLPGALSVAVGALLCIGFGALMARTSGFTHPLSAAGIDSHLAAYEQPVRAARLTDAPISDPAPAAPAPAQPPAAVPPRVTVQITPAAVPAGWSCAAAVAYLDTHSAPGFTFICPGYALGHQAMTCDHIPGVCPGRKIIVIAVPCPAAYENEAWNSRVLESLATGPLDPYGSCRR